MQVIRQKSDGLVMYLGADLSAPETTNLGVGWCDSRVSVALAEVITVDAGSVPVNWLPDCWTYIGSTWAPVAAKQSEIDAASNLINTRVAIQPTGFSVANVTQYTGLAQAVTVVALLTWDDMGISIKRYESGYKLVADSDWTELPATAGLRAVTPVLPEGSYDFRVRAINTEDTESIWTESGSFGVGYTAGTVPDITGLELWGQGLDVNFNTVNPRFRWNTSPGLTVPGQQTLNTDSSWHKYYKVEIRNTDTTVRRTFYTIDPNFTYTFEDNTADGNGTPARTFEVRVWDVFMTDEQSPTPATITAVNAQIATLQNVTVNPRLNAFEVAFDMPTELDFAGAIVWGVGLPTVIVGKQDYITVQCDAGSYDVNIAAFDTFDALTLNGTIRSIQVVDSISAVNVLDWAEEVTRYFGVPAPIGDVWVNNNPVAGSVSWNAHVFYYDGTKHNIVAGNTADPYIYWSELTPTQYQSTSDEAAFNAMMQSTTNWQIAANLSGVHSKAWLAVPNMVVGKANMGVASVENAAIGNEIKSDNFSIVEGVSAAGWQIHKDGTVKATDLELYSSDGKLLIDGNFNQSAYSLPDPTKLAGRWTFGGDGTSFPELTGNLTNSDTYDSGYSHVTGIGNIGKAWVVGTEGVKLAPSLDVDDVTYPQQSWVFVFRSPTEAVGFTNSDRIFSRGWSDFIAAIVVQDDIGVTSYDPVTGTADINVANINGAADGMLAGALYEDQWHVIICSVDYTENKIDYHVFHPDGTYQTVSGTAPQQTAANNPMCLACSCSGDWDASGLTTAVPTGFMFSEARYYREYIDVTKAMGTARLLLDAASGSELADVAVGAMGMLDEINASNFGTYIKYLEASLIKAGTFTGLAFQTAATHIPNGRTILASATNDLKVYDNAGVLRVQLGKLT